MPCLRARVGIALGAPENYRADGDEAERKHKAVEDVQHRALIACCPHDPDHIHVKASDLHQQARLSLDCTAVPSMMRDYKSPQLLSDIFRTSPQKKYTPEPYHAMVLYTRPMGMIARTIKWCRTVWHSPPASFSASISVKTLAEQSVEKMHNSIILAVGQL
eukprot:SAG11_NODE_1416_length_4973_cov_2.727329_4_plen_161_part_00